MIGTLAFVVLFQLVVIWRIGRMSPVPWWSFSSGKHPEDVSSFTNTLGMRFVSVPVSAEGKKILFSIWETRVKDYEVYASENPGADGGWRDLILGDLKLAPQDTCPVVKVSWDDARAFCRWLTKRERTRGRIAEDLEYRLPTDAEWSWAVGIGAEEEREGGQRSPKEKNMKVEVGTHPFAFPWGSTWPPVKGAGNFADASSKQRIPSWTTIPGYDDGYPATSPVGSFPANAVGLHDLGGNAREWCEDFYDGVRGGHLLRGGSWAYFGSLALSSIRFEHASERDANDGFRVVLAKATRTPSFE